MKRRRCDSPFSFRSTIPVHAFAACIHAHVCVCVLHARLYIQTQRTSTVISVSPLLLGRGFSPSTFPTLSCAFLFATLLGFSILLFHPPPFSFSLVLFLIPFPSVSSSCGLDEKSEYATIFKWQPRDTLLNALFASPPTSPACLPFYRPLPLCIGRRSTILFGCRPDRDEHVARCLIKNSPTEPSL